MILIIVLATLIGHSQEILLDRKPAESTLSTLEEMDISKLSGKRIGYYIGSFDPFHNGHKKLIDQILQNGLLDYVIIYPVPGGDQYKSRSDFSIRKEMIRAVCKTNSGVITTDLTPAQMQALLSPYFGQVEIIGIIGSDVVIDHISDQDEVHRQKVSKVFMRGLSIPEKHSETTIGAIMALPATSFIVSLRNDSDLSHLASMFEDRSIQAFVQLEAPDSYLSSTKVREAVRTQNPVVDMVDPSVEAIIKKYGLYTQ